MKKIGCIIVDDEIEAQDRLASILKPFDYVDIIAKIGDPDEAIKKIIELKPELVFLDIEMPSKSGFDVVKEVRNNNVTTKFIFVTGYGQYAIRAIRTEAFDYLPKPIDIDDLKEALERFINMRKQENRDELPQEFIDEFKITDREIEIIKLLLLNLTSEQIAEKLFIAATTVSTHRKNILKKTNTNSTNELISIINTVKYTH